MRELGERTGDIQRMPAWAGQSAALARAEPARAEPARAVVARLWTQAQELLAG